MTDTPPPPPSQWGPRPEDSSGPTPDADEQKKRPKRIFLWVFLGIQVLFLIWIITGISASGEDASCEGLTGDALELCRDAGDVGTAIGVGLIIGLWAAVDIILGVTYGIYRLSRRR